MPDYIYLLENRLSADQQHALRQLREAAREAGMILFLTGDAVRDLTSGHSVRDLEVSVYGNALNLKKICERLGGTVWGENEASRSLYLCFPGTVRVDVISTHRAEYPKPGKPVFHPASIQEDLRRRDFTVNAMAISLNEGSFGLLMDPLNGAADIEARTLRLVSNYGFLEEPSLLIRATRYLARLGWEFDPKTQARYENAKVEGVIEYLSAFARSQELEQIGHEEEGLKILRTLEAEGWMKFLFPAWTSAKADEEKLKTLHDLAVELQLQGVHADISAAQMQLLTSRLGAKDLSALKKLMLRPGFVGEWNSLDSLAAGFAKVLMAKENATPSASFKLFTSYDPEAVLWLGFTSKDAAIRERFDLFLKVWPEARQRIPHALMQEMRVTPELSTYHDVVQAVFLELIDGRLNTPEEIRAFLEPHSPPAPPPQVTIKRPRAKRGADVKLKERSYDEDEEPEDGLGEEEDLDDIGDEDEIDLGLTLPKVELDSEIAEEAEPVEDELEEAEEPGPAPVKRASKKPAPPKVVKEPPPPAPAPAPVIAESQVAAVPAPKSIAPKPEKKEKLRPAPKPEPTAKPTPAPKPVAVAKPAPASKPAATAKHALAPKPASVAKPTGVVAKPQATTVKAKPSPAPPPAKSVPAPPVKKVAQVAVKGSKVAKPSVAPSTAPKEAHAKVPVKAPVKPPAKTPAKTAGKIPAKAPVKPKVSAPQKKAAPAKSVPASRKPAPSASSKAGKVSHAAKPTKPAPKKPAPKGGKKR
jgi:tRNA nucleotidyltransferase/poly(A) polymerase